MRTSQAWRVGIAGLIMICVVTGAHALDVPEGFTALYNGENLDGWWGAGTENPAAYMALPDDELAAKRKASLDDINAHWSAEGDELVNDGHGLCLTTEKNYGDFELLIDYRTVAGADSGIYLRGIPQVQIWDPDGAGSGGSGGLYNNPRDRPGQSPLVKADRPVGEWNHFRIVMVGERVSVHFNDELVVDHARLDNYFARDKPVPRTGPIQLQTHGGEIRWRNIFIREIEAEEANAILAANGEDQYESVFNGADFTGWAGPTDNYEIVDGTIKCRLGHGGTIFTEDAYEDFSVRFEFQLPPGGNNGLAIRYPGEGDTAYVGMCELQVLDNTHEKFANLDPRQYHGSAYGQAPAARGYLRPTGAWNFQQVTVVGSRIEVELNGTVILDVDFDDITDFMYDKERFAGRDRTSGHFGFAGHNDPVRFREISIRRIEAGAD